MTVFKSTTHILNNPFEKLPPEITRSSYAISHAIEWDYSSKISIDDVKMWEQIYYYPGFLGIYVSHAPQIEFYMITYNLFIDQKKGIEIFYGESALDEVLNRCKELNIDLPIKQQWINL